MTTLTFFIICTVITAVLFAEGHSMYLLKRAPSLNIKDTVTDPKKRPFCNAFTGCGRKRSNLPALMDQGEPVEESIGSLLELSAEPAVEDLSRQIMSEAKLWEAIQEANVELNRRRQQSAENADDNAPARGIPSSCALPPCYI